MKKTIFVCDQCSSEQLESDGFPFDKKWVKLEHMTVKFLNLHHHTGISNHSHKHFCSKNCLKQYIEESVLK